MSAVLPMSTQVRAMIDVRDMLCAQALARADMAMRALEIGAVIDVVCNAVDVRDDLLIWAKELSHVVLGQVADGAETRMQIQKGKNLRVGHG